jgi:hypothetical protein
MAVALASRTAASSSGLLGDGLVDDEPPGAHAALAGVDEPGLDRGRYRAA